MRKIIKQLTIILGIFILCYSSLATADREFVQREDVQAFMNHMVKQYGFHKMDLIKIFSAIKIRPPVMRSIKAPLELAQWHHYRKIFITPWHVQQGIAYWKNHATILAKAEKIYGVPASIIVATIGIETKYGKNKGNYPVIDALGTIAFSDSPRASYFRTELQEFLLLSREQHLNPLTVKGSYAGAIGQPQFMPSSYRLYATNFSGKKHIDLSNNIGDIVASIANYYKKHGWRTNSPIAAPCSETELRQRGIAISNKLTKSPDFKIIKLQDKYANEYWRGYHNFDVIKRYNSSDLYAMAVYQLSNYLAAQKRVQS